jgi:3D (Asp-Asp-Asp) domain-containing protein
MSVNFFSTGRRSGGRLAGFFGILAGLILGGCSTVDAKRSASRPDWLCVRSTAYTHSEPGGGRNAVGTRLRFGGEVSSAAADWSWLPLGTRFRVQETGRSYVVEDYGSGLVGKKTVDLYVPNESMMRGWGLRWVTVEILEWGSPAMSRMLLERRRDARPVRQMLAAMDQQKE